MVFATAACSGKGEIREARRSLYDTDFAVVYGSTLDVIRDLYPNLVEDPTKGKISTAWHPVRYDDPGAEDPKSVQTQDRALGYDPTSSGAGNTNPLGTQNASVIHKRFFIRFDVTVAGGRPWRIRVVGHASEWEPGNAVPSEMKGAATPHWLPGRTEALVLAIHKQLKQFAILAPEEVAPTPDAAIEVDVTAFGPIAPDAAKRIGAVKQAISRRDIDALRPQLATDVTWSLGGAPGVEDALAMWQADPAILEAMTTVIDAGCRGDEAAVVCPPAASETPGYTGWRLTVTRRDDGWLVTGFVQGD